MTFTNFSFMDIIAIIFLLFLFALIISVFVCYRKYIQTRTSPSKDFLNGGNKTSEDWYTAYIYTKISLLCILSLYGGMGYFFYYQ